MDGAVLLASELLLREEEYESLSGHRLKGPQATSKINALRVESFKSNTWFYNGLQVDCPIWDAPLE